ncbi:MAG: hypothetical protein AB4058_18750 [Microcystaceae cyanobacterium]
MGKAHPTTQGKLTIGSSVTLSPPQPIKTLSTKKACSSLAKY